MKVSLTSIVDLLESTKTSEEVAGSVVMLSRLDNKA